MKISKLFHWLYATLMFLPLICFLPSCVYYAFNEHAVIPTSDVQDYQQEYIDFNQLYDGRTNQSYSGERYSATYNATTHLFTIDVNELDSTLSTGLLNTRVYDISDTHKYIPRVVGDTDNLTTYDGVSAMGINRVITPSTNQISLTLYITSSNTPYTGSFYYSLFDLTQMFGVGNEPTYDDFIVLFPNDYYDYTLNHYEWVNIPLGTTTTYADIGKNIEFAWERLWDLPLFAWCKYTFIKAPFTYITGLFGLASDNPINYLFGYFASISICWLVFDLIMYVPNLAHRWLDRSSLE